MSDIVVISGVAQGMGRETALELARKGITVAGFDVDKEGVNSLQKELDTFNIDHHIVPLDITNKKGILKFRDEVLEKFEVVDTVVSNVGIGFFGPFEEIDLDAALKCFEINVIGAAALFQAFIPAMRERRQGKLIAVSSLVGRIPFPFESIYAATKFALHGLVMSFKLELEPFGIRVAMIEPAQVSTGFAAKIHKLPDAESPYRQRVKRFIDKDEELIKSAPDPMMAAKKYVEVITAKKPKLYNQIDHMSTFFLTLNQYLPIKARDYILVNHMDIKV